MFETHIEDGHIILSAKSRISDTPSCKFLLTESDCDGLRSIFLEVSADLSLSRISGSIAIKEVFLEKEVSDV